MGQNDCDMFVTARAAFLQCKLKYFRIFIMSYVCSLKLIFKINLIIFKIKTELLKFLYNNAKKN